MRIYTAYDPPPKVVLGDFEESMTRQSEADSCDINKIVSRYKVTGVLPSVKTAAVYADVSQMQDYRGAVEQVREGDAMFMKLPSGIRAKFENDPAVFLDFVSDPDNHSELVELGLVKAPAAPVEGAPVEPEVDV